MDTKQEGRKDMQAHMEVYRKYAEPGAPHELLASMAGSWDTRTKAWMDPSQPPIESSGTCEQKMILGGRYLHQDFSGDMMGAPFVGIGVTGYDNYKQKYVSTWIDSMSTAIFFFEGTADGKTIIQECRHDDPVKGPMTWRSVTRVIDDNNHRFEMYGADTTGKEEKMMEIAYTRKR